MTESRTKNGRKTAHAAATPKRPGRGLYELEADAIKAVAHPKRLMIIDLLSDGTERTVTQLVELTGISQSNVSQNLAIMRAAGLVAPRRDGQSVYYGIRDARFVKAVIMMRTAMGDLLKDEEFVSQRAAAKRKEKARRAATYAMAGLAGLLALAAVTASVHPVFVGQGWSDVPAHVVTMAQSGDLGVFVQTCVDAGAEAAGKAAGRSGPASVVNAVPMEM